MMRGTIAAVSVMGAAWFLNPSTPAAAAGPAVHEYTIADGWGARAWNTPQTIFRMHVGDTFRITNLDRTADHTLHTPGAPCPHGGTFVYDAQGNRVSEGRNFDSIPVGGWLECVLENPIENADDKVYDHFQYDGVDGRIFLSVTAP